MLKTKKEKELVKELNANMPEFTGSPVEVEKKISMYIYLELGKRKVFDERYLLGNCKQRKKIVRSANSEKHQMDKIIDKRKLVCITLASLYRNIARDFGLHVISDTLYAGDDHVSNVIRYSDGQEIIVDLQRDLHNIQTGSRTQAFGQGYFKGFILQEFMSGDELFELHKSCGYVNSKEDYMEEKIKALAERVKELPPNEILKEIINDKDINQYQENIGYIEMFKYYSNVINAVARQYDKQGIYYCNCYREIPSKKDETEREYSMCMYSVYKDNVDAYLYSNVDKKFKKTELETFEKLERQGLHIGKDQQEGAVKVLRRYINKGITDRIKAKYADNYEKNAGIEDILK